MINKDDQSREKHSYKIKFLHLLPLFLFSLFYFYLSYLVYIQVFIKKVGLDYGTVAGSIPLIIISIVCYLSLIILVSFNIYFPPKYSYTKVIYRISYFTLGLLGIIHILDWGDNMFVILLLIATFAVSCLPLIGILFIDEEFYLIRIFILWALFGLIISSTLWVVF